VQFLSGGQHGRGYERALRALHAPDPLRWLERARATGVPVSYGATVSGRDPDPGEADAAGWSGLADWLARQPRAGAPPSAPAVRAIPGELTSDYAPVPGGQLHFHFNDDASTTPLLIQHDAASSVGTVEPITRSLVGRRSVMAFDLPGSGDSDDALPPDPLEVTDYAGALERALAALRLGAVDFYGMWGGGFVGLELARVQPGRIRRLVVSNLFFHEGEELRRVQANYTPDVSPLWHGGHLLQAWHQMRDQGLFYPWFERTAAGALRREPYLDTAMVHERVCSLLKAGNRYRSAYQAHFVYPTLERLRSSPVPTLAATSEWDPNRPHTEAAAAQAPEAEFRLLDADFRRWGLSFLDFLERR
jgi:pimeloyl-ACP methyl ester carboxylesterase